MNNYNNWTKESLINEIEKLYSEINKKDSTNRSINKGLIELQNRIEKAINYLKSEKNFDGELFLHTDRLVQKVLLNILTKDNEKEF